MKTEEGVVKHFLRFYLVKILYRKVKNTTHMSKINFSFDD